METINRALSSPPLSSAILAASKAYVFLVPHIGNKVGAAAREQIVGCVVAQRISTAMALTSGPDASQVNSSSEEHLIPIHIDATTALYVQPTPLPTPLGISRLFVSAAHRRQGVAESLLDAAAETFIHGCPLDPALGHVAFTQPTNGGQAVMQHWGKGGVRIYEE
jgi:N-acetyltransferase